MTTRAPIQKDQSQRIPDALVDAFFDRELDEASREHFFTAIRGDLRQCARVACTQRMLGALREPLATPDFTDAVMARVAQRRGFLPARLRRMVKVGRLIAAAVILAALLGVAILHRVAPDTVILADQPRPVSNVVTSSAHEATEGVQQIAIHVGDMKARLAEPAAELGRLLVVDDAPLFECGDGLRAARVYMVGALAADGAICAPAYFSAEVSLAIYGGSGSDSPFVVPSVVYLDDASTRVVMPPAQGIGGVSSWVGTWRENLFLLQSVSGGPGAGN